MKIQSGFKTIGIIGLGLMGGSLAGALRRRFPQTKILGVSRSASARNFALRKKWVHQASRDLTLLASADFIILCSPVDVLTDPLKRLDSFARPGTVVTDVGSVKGEIEAWAGKQRFKNLAFAGSHPMAGSHKQGIEAADPSLYDQSLVFITKTRKTNPAALRKVKTFWKKLTPRIVSLSPETHDQIVAEISHLPHAVANCLVRAVGKRSLPFAAGSFRDTTRIAQSHPSIWLPIFLSNRKAVLKALNSFEKELKTFRSMLQKGRQIGLRALLADAAKKRGQITF